MKTTWKQIQMVMSEASDGIGRYIEQAVNDDDGLMLLTAIKGAIKLNSLVKPIEQQERGEVTHDGA